MSETSSNFSTLQEKKTGIKRWINKILYQVYYKESVEENRSDLFLILAREVILSPLYMKTPWRVINDPNNTNHKENLRNKVKRLTENNLNGKYNTPRELMGLAKEFNHLSNQELKEILPCFIR